MAIDPNTLEWSYRSFVGSDSSNQKANYSLNFNSGGQEYTFIPESVIEKGVDIGKENYVFPTFLNQNNITKLGETGQYIDLNGVSWYGDYLKDNVGASTKGFLIPANSFDFGAPKIVPNNVKGVGNTREGLAYILETPEGKVGQYLASDGKVTTLTKTGGSSFLGNALGDWFDDFTESTGIQGVAGEVNDFFQTDLGKAIRVAALVASLGSSSFGDAAAQEVTTEAAAQEAASQAATEAAAQEAAAQAASTQASSITAADIAAANATADPIAALNALQGWSISDPAYLASIGASPEMIALNTPAPEPTPELLGEAGGNEFKLDLEPAGSAPTPLGDATSNINANLPDNIDAGNGWSPATGATAEELTKARAAMASTGWTLKQALDAVRAGLLVNAITGDPLGLSGSAGGGSGGSTGFAQVEIPAEWKSPTYAAPSAPIDLSSIFSNQNMLGGTQWQNLPSQQPNVSFNDIFASGQQQTPMGTPVDINQIVSAILGQTATSQKPA